MKTTLILLLGSLILLTTPIFALAHGGEHDNRPQHHKQQVSERHGHGSRHDDDRSHRWERRTSKHAKQQHRWERRANKHAKQQQRQRRYDRHQRRPYYVSAPAVVYSVPRVVFRFNW